MKYFFLIFIIIIKNTYAQQYLFEHFSIEQGLSQSNVRCILQDKHGFLWLGTQDGLNRFDGYSFLTFKNIIDNSNSLSANYIDALVEDKAGNIWIATEGGGICRYNPSDNSFKKYLKDTDKSNLSDVLTIYIDKNDEIWVCTYFSGTGTYTGSLCKFDPVKDSFISIANNKNKLEILPSNIIITIFEDSRGNFWLGSLDKGLILFDRNNLSYKSYTCKDGLASNFVTSISEDKEGNLVVGTNNGLSLFSNGEFTNYYHDEHNPESLSSNKIKNVFVDGKGKLFIGTEDAGINCFIPETKTFKKYAVDNKNLLSISDNNIFCFYEDRSGILWIGTNNGLNKVKQNKKFETLFSGSDESSFRGKYVWAILEDSDKNLWVGTADGLYFVNKKNNSVKEISGMVLKGKIEKKITWAIAEDDNKNIWIGTNSGLYSFNTRTKNISSYYYNHGDDSYLHNTIRSLYIDKNILWLGTFYKGILKFDMNKKEFIVFDPAKGDIDLLNTSTVHVIYKDHSDNFWFCTSIGAFKYTPGNDKFSYLIKTEADENTYPYNETHSVYEDNQVFWFSTFGSGLIKYDPDKGIIKRFTEQEGLSNNTVYAILPDENGNLWLSTNKGISKFNIKDNTFKNFSISDGLPSDEFNAGSFLKSSSGKIYFGSINGLVSFFPQEIKDNENIPELAITSFKVFDKPFLNKLSIADGDKIELSYKDNFFSFEFATLDFTEPLKNQFAYMLEGYDDDWIYSGKRRYAAYTNLEPGKYLLKVRGCNNDNVWNNKGISVAVLITPPFWQTWWFRTIIFLTFISGVSGIYLRRVSVLKKENLRQEEFTRKLINSQETERMRIASELHDSIGQNLIIIKNRAAFGVDFPSEGAKEQLKEIMDISSQTIREVKEISYNLRPYQLGKLGLTKAIEAVIKNAGSASNMKFIITAENIDDTLAEENEIHFYRIVQECLNNTIKHSQASGVNISIIRSDSNVLFNYADDGIGFDKNNPGMGKEKTGMGLTSISERVNILHGSFNFETEPGKGVNISIQIPIAGA